MLHYNARQFITLLKVHGEVNSWVRVTHEIHEHWTSMNHDDSTVYASALINMHGIPNFMNQFPTNITICVKHCSILQWNNLLQKKNLNWFENHGVNAHCAKKLSWVLINCNTYCKTWSKFAKIWVHMPRVQFVFNTWMLLAMVINRCRDMNMKHIISLIIMFSYLHELTKRFNCESIYQQKTQFSSSYQKPCILYVSSFSHCFGFSPRCSLTSSYTLHIAQAFKYQQDQTLILITVDSRWFTEISPGQQCPRSGAWQTFHQHSQPCFQTRLQWCG